MKSLAFLMFSFSSEQTWFGEGWTCEYQSDYPDRSKTVSYTTFLYKIQQEKNKLGDRAIKQDRMRVALEILSSQQRSLKV